MRKVTLRGLALAAAFGFGVIGTTSAVAIVGLARALDRNTTEMADQVAGVRAAEGVERNLLLFDREDRLWRILHDPIHLDVRQQAWEHLQERLQETGAHIEGAQEARLVGE